MKSAIYKKLQMESVIFCSLNYMRPIQKLIMKKSSSRQRPFDGYQYDNRNYVSV